MSLWMTTRMPLTRANLQFVTGVPRAKLGKWLDQLVADGVLDVDADDDGEMVWGVRGAARAGSGPDKPEEVKKLGDLKREVASSTVGAAAGAGMALVKYGGNAAHSLLTARRRQEVADRLGAACRSSSGRSAGSTPAASRKRARSRSSTSCCA